MSDENKDNKKGNVIDLVPYLHTNGAGDIFGFNQERVYEDQDMPYTQQNGFFQRMMASFRRYRKNDPTLKRFDETVLVVEKTLHRYKAAIKEIDELLGDESLVDEKKCLSKYQKMLRQANSFDALYSLILETEQRCGALEEKLYALQITCAEKALEH